MTFEKIKKFLDEKIFHKKSQKLLMPGEDYENNKEIKKNGCRSIGFAYGNVWDSKHLCSRYGRKCTFINSE